jgi:Na+-driven multidrug efflux pump
MIQDVLRLGLPSVVCSLIFYLQESINLIFVSHIGDKHLISAIGLGNMIQNTFLVATFVSLNSALDTFVS